jgi:hypothetical protein
MFTRRIRLVVVSAIVAAAVAVPAAAIAYSSSPGAPSPTTTKVSVDQTSAEFAALAASAGISETRLQQGLAAAKQAGGNDPAGVAAFASAAGVSAATAQRVVTTVFEASQNRDLTGGSAAAALAKNLGISTPAAQSAFQRIIALNGKDGVDPHSAGFAAIAHDLRVSPERLAAALDDVKRALAGQ